MRLSHIATSSTTEDEGVARGGWLEVIGEEVLFVRSSIFVVSHKVTQHHDGAPSISERPLNPDSTNHVTLLGMTDLNQIRSTSNK
jgi:hypothetical protein